MISHILLDIEGTTCPISFVSEILFPYASEHLSSFLVQHGCEAEVQDILAATSKAWSEDTDPEARELRKKSDASAADYLKLLIRRDRKFTPLKDLQGRIWLQGYRASDLRAPLFEDVAPALQRWHQRGFCLSVYSSGSVEAQQLLYTYSTAGDLSPLFSHWFDTRTGAKQESNSYELIAEMMRCPSGNILFISDSIEELHAANMAGLRVLFSDRPGNPRRDAGPFSRITDYWQLYPEPSSKQPQIIP